MKALCQASVVVLSLAVQAVAGQANADRDLAMRIATVTNSLDPDKNPGLTDTQWDDRIERGARTIRAEIARFIETQIDPGHAPSSIEARLKAVMASQERIDEESDDPTARNAKLRYGNALIVGYTVALPFHRDSAQIYGFKEESGRFRLVATTGEDFAGYSMSTRQVSSPAPDLYYLLAFGKRFTFNGTRNIFRLYSFDGSDFTPLWSPEDVFNAEVKLTARGFAITYSESPRADEKTDEYQTTLGGVVKIQ